VSDIFREIEEDLQRDRYKKLWAKYGNLVIAAAVALVLGTAGWQGWKAYKLRRDQAFSARYVEAVKLAEAGKASEAEQSLSKLAQEAGSGYAALARLERASLLAKAGKTAEAAALYDKLAADSGVEPAYRDLARLLGVLNSLDKDDPAQLARRLEPLTVATSPWRFSALELQALLAQRGGDKAKAEKLFGQLADDATAPAGVRARAAEMLAALKE
jgi:hypothetical protein